MTNVEKWQEAARFNMEAFQVARSRSNAFAAAFLFMAIGACVSAKVPYVGVPLAASEAAMGLVFFRTALIERKIAAVWKRVSENWMRLSNDEDNLVFYAAQQRALLDEVGTLLNKR